MFGCTMFACAMLMFQSAHENQAMHEEALGHQGSEDLSWVHTPKPAPVHIRGPVWSRGVSLFRTKSEAVWAGAGPSGKGTTFGLGMTVDF